jgi:hypothetical protein
MLKWLSFLHSWLCLYITFISSWCKQEPIILKRRANITHFFLVSCDKLFAFMSPWKRNIAHDKELGLIVIASLQ